MRRSLIFASVVLIAFLSACSTKPQNAPTPSSSPSVAATAAPSQPSAAPTPELKPAAPALPNGALGSQTIQSISPIASGGETCFVIKSDGRLFGWGVADMDTLGGGESVVSYEAPKEIMKSVQSVSGGQWATLIVDFEGKLWGIGSDYFGHLGNVPENTPQPVKIMDDVVCASAAARHCLALKKDGSLWCWGQHTGPVKIMEHVFYAVAARDGGYVIRQDGSLWEWGFATKEAVKMMDDVQYVDHETALKTNGDLMTWSYTEDGKRTEAVLALQDVKRCGMGVAVQEDGSLWTWGDNRYGQLGDGTNIDRAAPVKIMDDVAYAKKSNYYTLIVQTDGSLWQSGHMGAFDASYAVPYKIGDDVWLPEA
ncbi:MAG: hypothetical protein RRY65_06405 [Pseudoflavonifractor sp.]